MLYEVITDGEHQVHAGVYQPHAFAEGTLARRRAGGRADAEDHRHAGDEHHHHRDRHPAEEAAEDLGQQRQPLRRRQLRHRHNVGFMVVDELAARLDCALRSKFSGEMARAQIRDSYNFV